MAEFLDRTGEELKMKSGAIGRIVKYRNCKDIDVQFECGRLIKHTQYANFKRGRLAPVSIADKRIGEIVQIADGTIATIINYRNCKDLDVRLIDGTIIRGTSYYKIKNIRSSVQNQKKCNRIGEKNLNNSGEEMSIVAYRNRDDIDVQFNDGTLRTHVRYWAFKNGQVSKKFNSNTALFASKYFKSEDYCKSLIGKEIKNSAGLLMKIIAVRTVKDIDVKFEDGVIVKNQRLYCFRRGSIVNPKFQIGRYKQKGCSETTEYYGFTNIKYACRLSNGDVFYEATTPQGIRKIVSPQMMLSESKTQGDLDAN